MRNAIFKFWFVTALGPIPLTGIGNVWAAGRSDGKTWISKCGALLLRSGTLCRASLLAVVLIASVTGRSLAVTDWERVHPIAPGPFVDLAYANGRWIANVERSNRLVISLDGIHWHYETSVWSQDLLAAGELFFAVRPNAYLYPIRKSRNGVDWFPASRRPFSSWTGATFAQGMYIAVGSENQNGAIHLSFTGEEWEEVFRVSGRLWDVATDGQQFVAVGDAGKWLSGDGRNWSQVAEVDGRRIVFAESHFIALAEGGVLRASGTGVDWDIFYDTGQFPEDIKFTGLAYGNGMTLAASEKGPALIVRDGEAEEVDLRDYFGGSPESSLQLRRIEFGGGRFVAIAKEEAILFSSAANQNCTWREGLVFNARLAAGFPNSFNHCSRSSRGRG